MWTDGSKRSTTEISVVEQKESHMLFANQLVESNDYDRLIQSTEGREPGHHSPGASRLKADSSFAQASGTRVEAGNRCGVPPPRKLLLVDSLSCSIQTLRAVTALLANDPLGVPIGSPTTTSTTRYPAPRDPRRRRTTRRTRTAAT